STRISMLSLHDVLPIWSRARAFRSSARDRAPWCSFCRRCCSVSPAGWCCRTRRDFPDVVRRVCPVATVRVCPATAITPVQLVGGGCGVGERVPRVLFGGVFVGPEGCCRVQVERCVDGES